MKKKSSSAVIFTGLMAAVLVIVGGAAAFAAGPDLSGNWHGTNGADYNIVQIGTTFNWKVPATGEVGVGNISGKTCSAGWPFGFATGNIITDPAGNAVEIHWNNGVNFIRIGPPPGVPGGPPPGPGPGLGPTPPPPTPPGGSGSELNFSFGPNPAWPGAEVWVNLSLPVAHKVNIWHNGAVIPITGFKGNNFLTVKLPMNVTPGTFKVEYQGKHYVSTQALPNLEIKPLDIGGNWNYKEVAPGITGASSTATTTQNGVNFTCKLKSAVNPSVTLTYTGTIYNGNKLTFVDSSGKKISGSITSVDENGRAQKFEIDLGGGAKGQFGHP